MDYEIITKTTCLGIPGAGGFASIIIDPTDGTEISVQTGKVSRALPVELEIAAIIAALEKIPQAKAALVRTETQFIPDVVLPLISEWKANNWIKVLEHPYKLDACRRIDRELSTRRISWGLSSDFNDEELLERCGALAKEQASAEAYLEK